MADALSHKSYCNNIMIMGSQPPLHEEFQNLNLGLVPQGYLASLTASPTLEDKIRSEQRRDAEIKKIIENIKAGNVKYECFSIDDKGTVFFQGRIAVPEVQSLKDVILRRLMILLSPYTLIVQRCTRISQQCIGGPA